MSLADPSLREPDFRPAFGAALAVILSLVVLSLGWGMFARLDSATVAQGVLFAESERKTVESLEGGILERLLVEPGDRVAEGQVVAVLDATQTREKLVQLQVDRQALSFDIWRLEQEARGARTLDPATAPGIDAPGTRTDMLAAQQRLFDARLRSHDGQIEALRREIDALRAQIAAAEGQADAAGRQIGLWQEERAAIATLADRGATPRQRLMDVDRTLAALDGQRTEQRNVVRAATEDIARAEAQIETAAQARLAEIGTQMAEARRMLDGVVSRIRATEDVLERHDLRAPQDGVIVDIATRTPGAVIGSGVALMELVPDGDRLMILARIPPEAIDTVHPGRPATVHLTAFRRAIAPTVEGTVAYVSADLLQDERDGSGYFEARIAIDPASLDALPGVSLVSGMPVEVAIRIGERRAGEYLLEPILRHLRGAFREE